MPEHPLIELYVNITNAEENTRVEQLLTAVDLDAVVVKTLAAVAITQPVMLTLLITDDEGIREMNKQYRDQNKATDVLSFPLSEAPLVDAPSEQLWPIPVNDDATSAGQPATTFVTPPDMITNLGDIVMSWPVLERQADEVGHAALTELLYLLAHGVLHLVGYDDQTEVGYEAMVHIQRSVLQACGYIVQR